MNIVNTVGSHRLRTLDLDLIKTSLAILVEQLNKKTRKQPLVL